MIHVNWKRLPHSTIDYRNMTARYPHHAAPYISR